MNVAIIDANRIDDLFGGDVEDRAVSDIHNNMFKALVDTGAQTTMVSNKVAEKVGLRPLGKVPIVGVGGISFHNNYLFHVAFVMKEQPPLAKDPFFTIHALGKPIEGGEIALENAGFDVLLGMDVISTGSLAVEGCGTFSFSF